MSFVGLCFITPFLIYQADAVKSFSKSCFLMITFLLLDILYFPAPAIKGSSQCVLKYGAREALDITKKFMKEVVRILMKHHGLTLLLH
ncbi:hypothetical protein LguiB_013137 [Lonicera macranthoides]